jgi:hypothetical protein
MATETVIVNVDNDGNGSFNTGDLTDEEAVYNFRVVADSVNGSGFGGRDNLEQVSNRVWEGVVYDSVGAVSISFNGLDAITFTTNPDSTADIEYIVNGKSKGVREQITVRPPFFKGLTKPQTAAVGALGLGALAAWKFDNPF